MNLAKAWHYAVTYEESAEHKEGQIIGEVQRGYQLGDRVLRPALVRVAKGKRCPEDKQNETGSSMD